MQKLNGVKQKTLFMLPLLTEDTGKTGSWLQSPEIDLEITGNTVNMPKNGSRTLWL